MWRGWLTGRAVDLYLANGAYHRLGATGEIANPDQSIAEDVKVYTVTTLSFVLMLLNSSFTIVAFSEVLWTISPLLFIVAVLYAALGSYVTITVGRPLVRLNYDQLDKEAGFRFGLVLVRENAEAIRLSHSEGGQRRYLLDRLDSLVANFRQITAVNRNVGFFSTGYNWLIQIIPALIIAPSYISGRIEFGVVTQSAMVFSTLVAAFSLIVSQYQSLSGFAAVVARLSILMDAVEKSAEPSGSGIEVVERAGCLRYERLTLLHSANGTPLIENLSVSVPNGAKVVVTGANKAAGRALFMATAGLAVAGSGRIIRPPARSVCFLPQRPYSPPGSLRQILQDEDAGLSVPDAEILRLLEDLGLGPIAAGSGGLDADLDWGARLSPGDQLRLAFARVLLASPEVVFIDRVSAELGRDEYRRFLHSLSERSTACVCLDDESEPQDAFDASLVFSDNGQWTWVEAPPSPHR